MMKIVAFFGFLALASSQTQCSWSSSGANYRIDTTQPIDQGAGVGGGWWTAGDFPKNSTTQDFRELFNAGRFRPNRNPYVYIGNSYPVDQNLYETTWQNQNRTDKIAQDPNIRVMGFKYAEIEAYNTKIPCVSIQGVEGFGVEIMVYALVDVEICIRHKYEANSLNAQSAQLFNNVCGQQRLQHCFIGPNFYSAQGRPTNFDYEIYVKNTNPPDMSVPVFYRSRKSEFSYQQQGSQFSSGNTEMWCQMISGSVDTTWPEFIAPFTIPPPPINAASGVRLSLVALAVVAGAFFM